MIIAGWLLGILGLAQVIYAGTIDVSQLIEGNRLIGLAPSVVPNADLVAQRAMIHQAGCATFLSGAVFLAAAYLKPAPPGAATKSWAATGAAAALILSVAAVLGFGFFLKALHERNADQQLVDQIRLGQANKQANDKLWEEVDRRVKNEAAAAAAVRDSGQSPPPAH
jgi:hypothetical protein